MNREELLRSARNLYENPGTNEALKVVLEETYPELKEREDERIRTRLIALVEAFGQGKYKDEMLAYIEKRKEQKPIISDEAIREGIVHFGITQYQIDNWLKKHIKVMEQKPAEWSEGEREDRVRDIVAAVNNFYDEQKAKELIDFLKLLYRGVEDEYGQEMLAVAYKAIFDNISPEKRTKEINDSLAFMRQYTGIAVPQPHWKPSEEQMSSLWQASIYYKSGKIKITGKTLESLYNDLQKL